MRLDEVRNLNGERRFYPAGQHPATYRWRWTLARLQELRVRGADTAEAKAYIERKLAEFEEGEMRAKRLFLERMHA